MTNMLNKVEQFVEQFVEFVEQLSISAVLCLGPCIEFLRVSQALADLQCSDSSRPRQEKVRPLRHGGARGRLRL